MNVSRNIFFSACVVTIIGVGCKKKAEEMPAPMPPPPIAMPAPTPEQPKEKPVYVYSGDRFRDPFSPSGASTTYQPDAVFDPQRAAVKGIILGSKVQSAVLSVSGGGTYFVKDGRIFDIMGKTIDGYAAKISKDKVTVTGESDAVFELKIPDSRGEEKSQ